MGGLYRHPRGMRSGGNLSVQVFVGGGGVTLQTLVKLALQVEHVAPVVKLSQNKRIMT